MIRVIGYGLLCITLMACANNEPSDSSSDSSSNLGAPDFQSPIVLLADTLGDYEWSITTSKPKAQEYFRQGMQLRWGFNMLESAQSMAEARREDPECAMCYWGEAFSLGSFLNGGMNKEKAGYAHAAIQKASELVAINGSDVEKDLISAATLRYPADYDPKNRRSVDQAFADAMANVYQEYPHHHEVATVYAVALFMLEERPGYRDLGDPDLVHLHSVLLGVLDEDIKHPGACHLYIHATESSQEPQRALECAQYLGDAVPGASHIQHMPSHTWNEVGYWGKSVRANIRAVHVDLKSKTGRGASYGPSHNLHMLVFSSSYDGQGAIAVQAGKDYAKITKNSMYHVLTLLRFNRFDEIPAISEKPQRTVPAGLWEFAQGYAAMRNGEDAEARRYLQSVQSTANTSDKRLGADSAKNLLGSVGKLLEGELHLQGGDLEAAIASFETAVELEDALNYSEPEPLPFAARHWLGAALLEGERFSDAEEVYREELVDHPHNGWSLIGLQSALRAQGKTDAAVDEDFESSWARSDIWATSSRF